MGKSNGYISHKHFLVTSLTHEQWGLRSSLRPSACAGDVGKGCRHSLAWCPEGGPPQPEAPMTPALAFGQLNVGTSRGCVHRHNPRCTVGVGRGRVSATCEAVWTAGLAWPPHLPLAPVCPHRAAPGLTHTTPWPRLLSGGGGCGLEAQHQERAWSRGWGWGAFKPS